MQRLLEMAPETLDVATTNIVSNLSIAGLRAQEHFLRVGATGSVIPVDSEAADSCQAMMTSL